MGAEVSFKLVEKAISELEFTPKEYFLIIIGCAKSYFYEPEKQRYQVKKSVYNGRF